MQAKKRYVLVLISCAFLVLCYFGGFSVRRYGDSDYDQARPSLAAYAEHHHFEEEDLVVSPRRRRSDRRTTPTDTRRCRMHTCFDLSRCRGDFKVYVHPGEDKISLAHRKILSVVQESRYYTTDPSEACVFVLSLDTLDRDQLSYDYVKNLQAKLTQVGDLWNNGRNHVVFNLFSGTWPNYTEELGFDPGRAILAKSSMASATYRPDFDVSIPLFHKSHPEKGGERGFSATKAPPVNKKYLLVFKGKRYLYGIGSETRNSLYHLNNQRNIVLLTTCKHGKQWKEKKDARCETDNREYDRYDYGVLMENSTFCLVPRGRRLGSFRFLEALQAGCIPVVLSNGWELPFNEVIDWNKAVIWADERLLLQVPDILWSVPKDRVHELQQQSQLLWETYFSSVEKIVMTTLEIIRERIRLELGQDQLVWNQHPGALVSPWAFSDTLRHFPFQRQLRSAPGRYTAVVHATLPTVQHTSPLHRLLKNLLRSAFLARVLIIWNSDVPPPSISKLPSSAVPIHIIQPPVKTISQRFAPHALIETDAVLSLDEDVTLTAEEMDFAFKVWQSFPERIVGYPARTHYWDDSKSCWGYTSKWTNEYSIVLTGAAFYHRYYNHLYTHYLNPILHRTVDQSQNCEDILMNFLVSHISKLPPIKVTQRKQYKESFQSSATNRGTFPSLWKDPDHFHQRQTCINTFATVFGYMPLLRSSMRLDPVLFRDQVSNLRKRYKRIEVVGSS